VCYTCEISLRIELLMKLCLLLSSMLKRKILRSKIWINCMSKMRWFVITVGQRRLATLAFPSPVSCLNNDIVTSFLPYVFDRARAQKFYILCYGHIYCLDQDKEDTVHSHSRKVEYGVLSSCPTTRGESPGTARFSCHSHKCAEVS
jgi:hypothetical protein